MTRTIRRGALLMLALTIAATLQLGSATMASAATTCKDYDQFPSGTAMERNVRVCAAPATDFPTYSGWGRVVEDSAVMTNVCNYSLLPYDVDDLRPGIACIAMMPAPIEAWRWTGMKWVAVRSEAFQAGSRAYFAPYASGWHWAWTQTTGWVAIESSHAAYRWYA